MKKAVGTEWYKLMLAFGKLSPLKSVLQVNAFFELKGYSYVHDNVS